MPAPLPDVNRDHQCYHYQAPSGQRCGSPALKGEYYCFHHLVKTNYKKSNRVLVDPEITSMELPPIEDRASIFIALAAVVHRLAENTIDTRRAGQMIYGLQVAMRALAPPSTQRSGTSSSNKSCHSERAQRVEEPRETTPAKASDTAPPPQPATDNLQPATPKTIQITKESLLYFLRSRHCYNCNTELFPAEELTYRRHPGAPAEVIEEAHQTLPPPPPATDNPQPVAVLPTLQAVAEQPIARNPAHRTQATARSRATTHSPYPETKNNRRMCALTPHSPPPLLYTLLGARYP